jgi:hypothetical protein
MTYGIERTAALAFGGARAGRFLGISASYTSFAPIPFKITTRVA